MLRALAEVHVPLVALAHPAEGLHIDPAARAGGRKRLGGVEGRGLCGEVAEYVVREDGRAFLLGGGLLRQPCRDFFRELGVPREAGAQIQLRGDKRGVVSVAQSVVRRAGLLDLEVLHRRREGLLVPVALHLVVVYELEIHPARYPVPVQVVYDDVLLHDALVVVAPGEEGAVLAAPGPELFHRHREALALHHALLVEAGELFDFVMHTAEIHRAHVYFEFLAREEAVRQLDGADFDDLSPEADGQLVEDRGF